MTAVRKFLFENSFDVERKPRLGITEQPPSSEPEPPPPPTFSEAELEAARAAAYEEGVAAGRAATEAESSRRLVDLVERIGDTLKQAITLEETARAARFEEIMRLGLAIARKILPDYARRHGLGEIEAMIGTCVAELRDEPRVVVRVHDSMLDALSAHVDAIAAQHTFTGRFVLLADDGMDPTDCRIEWADGGAERSIERLWDQIDRIAVRHGAPERAPSGKEGEPARSPTLPSTESGTAMSENP